MALTRVPVGGWECPLAGWECPLAVWEGKPLVSVLMLLGMGLDLKKWRKFEFARNTEGGCSGRERCGTGRDKKESRVSLQCFSVREWLPSTQLLSWKASPRSPASLLPTQPPPGNSLLLPLSIPTLFPSISPTRTQPTCLPGFFGGSYFI